MSNVVNRLTKETRRSANTPDFSVADWIINPPNFYEVEAWKQVYRVITGDVISLADQVTRDAIDAAILATQVAGEKIAAKSSFATSRRLKAFAELLVTELNRHTDRTNAILDAIDGATNLASLKGAIGAISDLPERDFSQIKNAIDNNIDAGAN